jgi:hypothetical protein
VAWQDQGRQEHGWFGHGTAPQDYVDDATNDSLFGAGGLEARIQAVAYGAVAALPSALREQAATLFDATHLAQLTETMKVWIRGARLDQAQFAALFFGAQRMTPSSLTCAERRRAPTWRKATPSCAKPPAISPPLCRLWASAAGHASSPMRWSVPAIERR